MAATPAAIEVNLTIVFVVFWVVAQWRYKLNWKEKNREMSQTKLIKPLYLYKFFEQLHPRQAITGHSFCTHISHILIPGHLGIITMGMYFP